MSIHNYLLSGHHFKKAKQLTVDARNEQAGKSDQLFMQAYNRFSSISESYSGYADALYYWGLALLHQAKTKPSEEAIKIFEEAITKFSSCKAISPEHLGAAIDGGVALLGLAASKKVALEHELYQKAKESFEAAENIQAGSASYNLACIYALQNKGGACLQALENAREHGLVPSEQDIRNDDDLQNIKNLPWFAEYLSSLAVEKEGKSDTTEVEEKKKEEESE